MGMQRILNNWFVKRMLAPFAVLCAFGWGYFQFNYPTIYYRFKLTVEVETPDGIKSSSVVNEEAYTFSYFGKEFMPSQGGGLTRAEALFIDLGSGKNLTVTLHVDPKRQYDSLHSLDMAAIGQGFCHDCLGDAAQFRRALSTGSQRGPFLVDISKLPNLITLVDVNNYKTMQHVTPTEVDVVLGAGYEIKSARFEIVDEPLAERIEKQLPWLANHAKDRGSFDGSQAAGPNSAIFSTVGYFSFKL
jgi:hypothetical protein